MTSLQKRLASAAVLGPLVLIILWNGGWPFVALVLLVGAAALWEWIGLARKSRRPWAFGAFGAAYIPLAAWGFVGIGPVALPLALAVYASDAAAYFAGRAIGGPKLWPSLSPRKTWSGFCAAVVCGALVLGILGLWSKQFIHLASALGEPHLHNVPPIGLWGLVAGSIVGGLGQAGDLLISALKRAAGAKDSGDLIPGHGGVLDRVDSLLLPCALLGLLALVS
jgi:phosphatidate cytidylyltransferase